MKAKVYLLGEEVIVKDANGNSVIGRVMGYSDGLFMSDGRDYLLGFDDKYVIKCSQNGGTAATQQLEHDIEIAKQCQYHYDAFSVRVYNDSEYMLWVHETRICASKKELGI